MDLSGAPWPLGGLNKFCIKCSFRTSQSSWRPTSWTTWYGEAHGVPHCQHHPPLYCCTLLLLLCSESKVTFPILHHLKFPIFLSSDLHHLSIFYIIYLIEQIKCWSDYRVYLDWQLIYILHLQQALWYQEKIPECVRPEAALLLLVRLYPPLLDRGPVQDDPSGHLLLLDRATPRLPHLDVRLHAWKHR